MIRCMFVRLRFWLPYVGRFLIAVWEFIFGGLGWAIIFTLGLYAWDKYPEFFFKAAGLFVMADIVISAYWWGFKGPFRGKKKQDDN